jgi:hypothetical protein
MFVCEKVTTVLLLLCAFSFNTRALYCARARLIQCLLEEGGGGGVSAPLHSRQNTIIIRCRVRHREEVYESSLSFFFLFREIIECATQSVIVVVIWYMHFLIFFLLHLCSIWQIKQSVEVVTSQNRFHYLLQIDIDELSDYGSQYVSCFMYRLTYKLMFFFFDKKKETIPR